MPEAWRIIKEKHAATAFTGEGAAKTGGRWSSRGVRIVYTSRTKALAALETLVHLNPSVPFKYVIFRAEFHNALVEVFPAIYLPTDWRVEPPPPSAQQIGDVWVKTARSAVLAVPSAIISSEPNYLEPNYLLNPAHPDFKKIIIGKPEPFTFDPRLIT